MIRTLIRGLAITALLLAAPLSTATAADLGYKAPPAPAWSWTGFYIGGNFGGGWGQSKVASYSANDPASALFFAGGLFVPPATSLTMFNVLGGAQAGFNWQFARNWVIGDEIDFDWSGMKDSSTAGPLPPGPPGTGVFSSNLSEHVEWFGTARIRLGFLPVNPLLVYVTGGFAYGRVDRTGSYVSSFPTAPAAFAISTGGFAFACNAGPLNPCFAGSSSNVDLGWTAGGGFEYALSTNLSLKAEYLYVSLAGNPLTETAPFALGLGTPSSFNANYGHTFFNVSRFGLNYRF
jgi:outer membrane immunogenic protein